MKQGEKVRPYVDVEQERPLTNRAQLLGHVVAVGGLHQPFQVGGGNIQCRKQIGVNLAGHHLSSAQNRPGPAQAAKAGWLTQHTTWPGSGLCSALEPRGRSLS